MLSHACNAAEACVVRAPTTPTAIGHPTLGPGRPWHSGWEMFQRHPTCHPCALVIYRATLSNLQAHSTVLLDYAYKGTKVVSGTSPMDVDGIMLPSLPGERHNRGGKTKKNLNNLAILPPQNNPAAPLPLPPPLPPPILNPSHLIPLPLPAPLLFH